MQQSAVESGARLPRPGRGSTELAAIIDELESICSYARQLEQEFADEVEQTDPRFREGARNLLHYMALRHVDIRPLQARLAALGLSSLGHCERHVMVSIQAVLKVLRALANGSGGRFAVTNSGFVRSRKLLDTHAIDTLGDKPTGRTARIMVTLPEAAATDPGLVHRMLESGMNLARINCAHDDPSAWTAMIRNVRKASAASSRPCRIVMDLAGPRLRTGSLAPGPKVVRVQPRRDALGRVIAPRRLRLVAATPGTGIKGSDIPVFDDVVFKAKQGDFFRFSDTRGKHRKLRVVGRDKHGLYVECYKPAYLETGTRLTLNRQVKGERVEVKVGELPARDEPILLRKNDVLILHQGTAPGRCAVLDRHGEVKKPAHISCTLPEVFRFVRAGATVYINDGKIKGSAESVGDDRIAIRITRAKPSGSKLRGNKGINFPGTDLHLSGLTDKDKADLQFVAANADAVALSFVNKPFDVLELQRELRKYPHSHLGIILKVETEQGFRNMARLLLAVMRGYPAGMMIARGDLAVECGWERLAEIQEEILWMCEAAHLPVIWATQVLESETRKGQPSRAEISDAAMSQRADCVMLNKGQHILDAIVMLDSILTRMQHHQNRKTATLRKLSITDSLGEHRENS